MLHRRVLFCFITSLSAVPSLTLCGADELPFKVPSSFRIETLHEFIYDAVFSPVSFLVSEIQFIDFANYRKRLWMATTIQREFLKDGLNLSCTESETVVLEGQLLELHRHTPEYFHGEVPNNRETLVELVSGRCQALPWDVFFSSSNKLEVSLGRQDGIVGLVGSLKFLSPDKSAFLIDRASVHKSTEETVEASVKDGKDLHRTTLQKWEGGWRVSQMDSTYASPYSVSKQISRVTPEGLVVSSQWNKTTENPGGRWTQNIVDIQHGRRQTISLSRTIKNGSPVYIKESPQLRAVWMDGKVVRVYEGGTVDDLGSANFRTADGMSGLAKMVLITTVLVFALGIVAWYRRMAKPA